MRTVDKKRVVIASFVAVLAAILGLLLHLNRPQPHGAVENAPTPAAVSSAASSAANAPELETPSLAANAASTAVEPKAARDSAREPTIDVSCIDARTRQPIIEFTVAVDFADRATESYIAQDGVCITPELFTVGRVTARGYHGTAIAPGDIRDRQIRCELRPFTHTGLVLRDGIPVAGCLVRVFHHARELAPVEPTDVGGRFHFEMPAADVWGVELRAKHDGAVGHAWCRAGQLGVTLHLKAAAALRVFADHPLPALEVRSRAGVEGASDGGTLEAKFGGLTPGTQVSVRKSGGVQLGYTLLGPAGSEESLFVVVDVPDVWVLLVDEDEKPLALESGARAELHEIGSVTSPPFKSSPASILLSAHNLSPVGFHSFINVLNSDGTLTCRASPASAVNDGGRWRLPVKMVRGWPGRVLHLGKPVEGARVFIGLTVAMDDARTDAQGRFDIRSWLDRPARLYAEWNGMRGFAQGTPGKEVHIDLEPARRLAVRLSGASVFRVTWQPQFGPLGPAVTAVDGEAVLFTPHLDGSIQVRADAIEVGANVGANEELKVLDLGEPVEIEVRTETKGQLAPHFEVTFTISWPRADGGSNPALPFDGKLPENRWSAEHKHYQVRATTGADGTTRVRLPFNGKWRVQPGFLHVDTFIQKSVVVHVWPDSRPRPARGTVEVAGLLSWQPTLGEGLRLYQSDRFVPTPISIGDGGNKRGFDPMRAGNATVGTRSYRAYMNPDLPYVLVGVGDRRLVPAGVLRQTPNGWRGDLTLDDKWRAEATVHVLGAEKGTKCAAYILGDSQGRQEVIKLSNFVAGQDQKVGWPADFGNPQLVVICGSLALRADLRAGSEVALRLQARRVINVVNAKPGTEVALAIGEADLEDWTRVNENGFVTLFAFGIGSHALLIHEPGAEKRSRALVVTPDAMPLVVDLGP